MRHTLAILVENRFGELARIVGLFSARGYNIESLTVAAALRPGTSRMTLVTNGDKGFVEQIVKQLNKQIRVLSVTNLTAMNHLEREMILVQVNADTEDLRREVMKLASVLDAKVIEVTGDAVTVEAAGERHRVDALLRTLQPFGIRDVARAGTLAIRRLSNSADDVDESAARTAVG